MYVHSDGYRIGVIYNCISSGRTCDIVRFVRCWQRIDIMYMYPNEKTESGTKTGRKRPSDPLDKTYFSGRVSNHVWLLLLTSERTDTNAQCYRYRFIYKFIAIFISTFCFGLWISIQRINNQAKTSLWVHSKNV